MEHTQSFKTALSCIISEYIWCTFSRAWRDKWEPSYRVRSCEIEFQTDRSCLEVPESETMLSNWFREAVHWLWRFSGRKIARNNKCITSSSSSSSRTNKIPLRLKSPYLSWGYSTPFSTHLRRSRIQWKRVYRDPYRFVVYVRK